MENNVERIAENKYSAQMTALMQNEHMLADGRGAFAGSIGPISYYVDVDLNLGNLIESSFAVKIGIFGVDLIDIVLDVNNPRATIDLSVSGVGVVGEVGIDFDGCRIYCSLELDYLVGSKTYTFDLFNWGNHAATVKFADPETAVLCAGANEGEDAGIFALVNALQGQMGGSITVRNEGGYIARFSVTYKIDGKENKTSSGSFTLGVSKTVDIPAQAKDIHVKIEDEWFPGQWTTIAVRDYATPVTKRFIVGGTTLMPTIKEAEV